MARAHVHGDERSPPGRDVPAELIRAAEATCLARGAELTPLRRRIFCELATAEGPLGAYDIVERIGRERRIAPISVYRILDFLLEAGLVHRIATRNTYLPCHHTDHTHEATVFLVCTRCGGVDEVDAPEAARELVGAAQAAGFRPGPRSVELEGECALCLAAEPA